MTTYEYDSGAPIINLAICESSCHTRASSCVIRAAYDHSLISQPRLTLIIVRITALFKSNLQFAYTFLERSVFFSPEIVKIKNCNLSILIKLNIRPDSNPSTSNNAIEIQINRARNTPQLPAPVLNSPKAGHMGPATRVCRRERGKKETASWPAPPKREVDSKQFRSRKGEQSRLCRSIARDGEPSYAFCIGYVDNLCPFLTIWHV